MKGYYREPEKTAAIIDAEGWLNSGDLLMWTAQGDLKFAGRAKDTIVLSGGENVEPEPIENSLKQSEYFTHVVVVGQDRKTLGALIVPKREKLLPLLNGSAPSDPERLEEALNQSEEIAKLVREEIKKYVSQETGYKAFERVTTFHILGGDFTVNDELTQTQKVKRNRVQEKYSKEIDRMFS
jgi:long-chain acyl-CoA synthetase